MSTKIEWTDKTWNPIIGCTKVSPACDNCYAERMACRLATMGSRVEADYDKVVDLAYRRWNGKTALVESAFEKPLHWRKPYRVFVGSMTDLFHKDTPDFWLAQVFATIALTPHITYQILTKRPERMREYMSVAGVGTKTKHGITMKPFPNVWLGVTVENQEQADKRIPILLDTPAAVRFVSVEPMLGPVDLSLHLSHIPFQCHTCGHREWNSACECPSCGLVDLEGKGYCQSCKVGYLNNEICVCSECRNETSSPSQSLDWVICGGETGHGARPMRPDWAIELLMQCEAAGVPFFFKKWGSYKGPEDWRIPGGEKIGGKIVREFPTVNGG